MRWSDAGETFTANESSDRRVFRSDALTAEGLYTELNVAAERMTARFRMLMSAARRAREILR